MDKYKRLTKRINQDIKALEAILKVAYLVPDDIWANATDRANVGLTCDMAKSAIKKAKKEVS